MLSGGLQTVSDILPNAPDVSSNLLGGLQLLSTTLIRLVVGKQAQSVTEILLQKTHALFILDSAAKKERQL